MSSVKICDRCGKKIEHFGNGIWPIQLITYRAVLRRERLYIDESYDLCDDCLTELFRFLNIKRVDNELEE